MNGYLKVYEISEPNEQKILFAQKMEWKGNENVVLFVLFRSFILQTNERARIGSAKRSRVILLAEKRAIGNEERTKFL